MTVDIVDTSAGRGRVEIRTGVGRKRRWTDEERGRIVAEAVRPGAVVSAVARRHDMSPQHLFRWIKAAKNGDFALPANEAPSFVPVVVEPSRTDKTVPGERSVAIEIAIGAIEVRVRNGADARTVAAVLRAVKWAAV